MANTTTNHYSNLPEVVPKDLTILIADDDADIIEFVTYNLTREGYKILIASNGKEALQIAKKENPDLIILDVMMPEMDGIEVCCELRNNEKFKQTIITFLSARNEDYSQIAGFESGGDDYITKPIRPRLLVSRINALMRHKLNKAAIPHAPILQFDQLCIDKTRFIVSQNEKHIQLARKEFEILYLLASYPQRIFTRTEIFSKIWGRDVRVGLRTIDVHIRKLRTKIGEQYIQTTKGIGYKFVH